jgi:spermidine synthase
VTEAAPKLPPGYRIGAAEHDFAQVWRPPFYFAVFAALVIGGAWHEVCVRQALAYGTLAGGPARWLTTLLSLVALAAGGLGAYRSKARQRPELWVLPFCSASAVLVAASAGVLFASFGSEAQSWLGTALAVVSGLVLGATAFAAFASVRVTWRQLSLFSRLLEPLRLVMLVLVAIVAATLLPLVGFLRAACLASGLIALVGWWHLGLYAYLERVQLPRARRWRWLFMGWAALMAASLVLSERWVSRPQIAYYQGAILHTFESQRSELVVTTGPLGAQLFVNRSLRAADVDRGRYFEALVHPAFAAKRAARRVLVLGAGDGLVEREVLAYPEVRTLDVVTEDAALARFAAESPWLSRRTGAAMRDARVHVIEAEPIVWLEATHAPYDLVIVDLPDPSLPRWGKNYTRYFFERVRAHVAQDGVVAVQAGSSQAAPQAFANVAITMQAAGHHTHPYHVAVPSIGDWGFVLGSAEPFERPTKLRAATRSLTDAGLRASFSIPRDSRGEPGAPSTLDNQRVTSLFLHSRAASLSH